MRFNFRLSLEPERDILSLSKTHRGGPRPPGASAKKSKNGEIAHERITNPPSTSLAPPTRATSRSSALSLVRFWGLSRQHSPARAAEVSFTGASATNPGAWGESDNWSGGAVPVAGDDVTIPAGFTVTNSASTPALGGVSVSGTLVFQNWDTALNATAVTVPNGGVLTCAGPFTDTEMSNRVWVVCTDFTLASGGKVDVNAKGWGSTARLRAVYGPGGKSGEASVGNQGGGAAHGGFGGWGYTGNGTVYGDVAEPVCPGSSGSPYTASAYAPMNGGGRIALRYNPEAQNAADFASLAISAAPGMRRVSNKYVWNYSEGWRIGDVGTVYFTDTKPLSLLGRSAISGALHFGTGSSHEVSSLSLTTGWVRFADEGFSLSVSGNLSVSGSKTRLEMGGGTYLGTTRTSPRLVSGATPWALDVGGNLTVSDGAWMSFYPASTNGVSASACGGSVSVAGDIALSGSEDGCAASIVLASCPTNGAVVAVSARNITVGEGTLVSAKMRGFALGQGLATSKAHASGNYYSANGDKYVGAGHGGLGRNGDASHGNTCGDALRPALPGSGGAWLGTSYSNFNDADSGGGAIWLKAAKALTVAGKIDASAREAITDASGQGYCRYGAAAGGSVLLECRTFSFPATGSILANGGGVNSGHTSFKNGACGGGGRIAVWTGSPYEEGLKASALTISESLPEAYAGAVSVSGGYFTDKSGAYRKCDSENGWQTTTEKSEATVRAGDGTIRFVSVEKITPTVLTIR